MLSTHRGVTMATREALSLLLLVVTTCEGASLILKPSTLRISPDGEANFTMNCTTDEASGSDEHSQIQKEIVDVQRMRISKMKNNRWEPLLQMDLDWQSPVVHPGVTGDHNLASGFLQATWPMAKTSTAGEYTCDLMGYGRSGQLISLRSPVIYIDVQLSMTLYDLFKMIKTSSKKFETDIAQNKEAIQTSSADIADIKKAIEGSSIEIADNKEMIEETSGEIIRIKKSFESSSKHIAQNRKAIETASAIISQNKEAIKVASANIIENKEAFKIASVDITENKEALEMVSADVTENKEAIEMDSVDIIQNEQAIKHTKTIQDYLNRMLQKTSSTVENNAATLAQIKRKQNFTTHFCERWPEGRYNLMEPKSGCPGDTATAQWSIIRHKIPVDASGVRISTGAHMYEPVITGWGLNKYMEMRHCSVYDSPSVGGPWPPGSYCFGGMFSHACPTGFTKGTITYGKSGPCPRCAGTIKYCCRKDSLPDTAILLPTGHPFYLYRFGGKCQHVWGMSVREEYMVIDTECCGSKYSVPVPDGKKTSSEITLQLCYYERDTNNE